MDTRALVCVVGSLAACGGPPPVSAPAKQAEVASAPVEPPTQDAAPPTAPPLVPPLTADEVTSVTALLGRFRGGKACDGAALDELTAMRERRGAPAQLRGALAQALQACGDDDAVADLLATTLSDAPSSDERMQVGAAMIRATRFDDAIAVLEPLAAELGSTSKAAWLLGFALHSAGNNERALPHLRGARAHAGGEAGSDASLLIGAALLQGGETADAIVELEAGLALAPSSVSLLSVLARAYGAAGRPDDAERMSAQLLVENAKVAEFERRQYRLSALSTALEAARTAGNNDEVDRLIGEMLPTAPDDVRRQLLTLRVDLYERTDRKTEAEVARDELGKLAAP